MWCGVWRGASHLDLLRRRNACRKCVAPLLGFSLPSTSFIVDDVRIQTSTGRPIATASTAMVYVASRGVCRIAVTAALWDGRLYCVAQGVDHGLCKGSQACQASEQAVVATLGSCVCKAVCNLPLPACTPGCISLDARWCCSACLFCSASALSPCCVGAADIIVCHRNQQQSCASSHVNATPSIS